MVWMAIAITVWLVTVFTNISILPAVIISVAGGFLVVAVMLAWVKFGRSDLPLKNLIAIPFYILGKIPIYLRFLVKPQSRWLKTERDLPSK